MGLKGSGMRASVGRKHIMLHRGFATGVFEIMGGVNTQAYSPTDIIFFPYIPSFCSRHHHAHLNLCTQLAAKACHSASAIPQGSFSPSLHLHLKIRSIVLHPSLPHSPSQLLQEFCSLGAHTGCSPPNTTQWSSPNFDFRKYQLRSGLFYVVS